MLDKVPIYITLNSKDFIPLFQGKELLDYSEILSRRSNSIILPIVDSSFIYIYKFCNFSLEEAEIHTMLSYSFS